MSHYFAPLSSCSVADAGAALASLPPLADAAMTDQDARVVLVADDSVGVMSRSNRALRVPIGGVMWS
jgi:hypothetical protein